MFHGFGRTAHHHDIPLLEERVGTRFPPDDSIAPHRADGGPGASEGELGNAFADGPSMRRQDDAVKLFTKCVAVIEKFGSRGAKILAQHAVPVAADVVHGADDPGYR